MAWSLFGQSQVSPLSWATAVLKAGGWPDSPANRQSLIAWAINEGGGGTYNPLNTTQGPGSDFNSVGVKNFASWNTGVTETVATINNGDYPNIVSDLKSGGGISSNASGNLQTWSGSGYGSVSQNWQKAAAYMGGTAVALPKGSGGGGSGSGSSAIGGWLGDILKAVSPAYDLSTAPASITEALGGIAVPFTRFAEIIDWWTVPSHWIRIFSGLAGGALVVAGLVSISRTGASYSAPNPLAGASAGGFSLPSNIPAPGGELAPALGILEIMLGSIGLFIAFHNLPREVDSLPALLHHLQGTAHVG